MNLRKKVMCIVLLVAVVIGVFEYQIYQLRKDAEKRQAQIEAQHKEFMETAISLQSQVVELSREMKQQRVIYPVSRGGRSVRGMLRNCEVTWYNDSGKTASGTTATSGRTVAVDPSVVPLGATVDIVFPDGTVLRRTAEDTGSAVVGKIFDIHIDAPNAELAQLGRTYGVTVFILGERE